MNKNKLTRPVSLCYLCKCHLDLNNMAFIRARTSGVTIAQVCTGCSIEIERSGSKSIEEYHMKNISSLQKIHAS